MTIIEIIKTTTVTQNKVYIPKEIRERLRIIDGDKIIWALNKDGELVVRNSKEPLPSSTIVSY